MKELYGKEDASSVGKLKEIVQWIEKLPIANLPYVDIGFDVLEAETVASLNN